MHTLSRGKTLATTRGDVRLEFTPKLTAGANSTPDTIPKQPPRKAAILCSSRYPKQYQVPFGTGENSILSTSTTHERFSLPVVRKTIAKSPRDDKDKHAGNL